MKPTKRLDQNLHVVQTGERVVTLYGANGEVIGAKTIKEYTVIK